MAEPSGSPRWDEIQGRDDRLANRIIALMESVRRISAGALDTLNNQLALARYPTAAYKIRKLPITALEPMHSLILGFLAQLQATLSPVLNTGFRDQCFDTVPTAMPIERYPFTLLSPLDNSPQVCVIYEDGAGPDNLDFGTYLNSNKSGILSSNVQLLAAANWTTTTCPNITKINDSMAVFRHFNLTVDDDLVALTLSAAGAVVKTKLTDLVETALYVDRAPLQDFSDGKYYWFFEYLNGTNSLIIHKLLLSDFSDTKQEVTSFKGTVEAFFHAYGDTWVLVGQESGGSTSRILSGSLADGATPVALDMLTDGDAYTQNTVELRGFVGAPMGDGSKARIFATTGEGTAGNGIVTSVLDLSSGTLVVTTESILGVAENWPIGLETMKQSGYNAEAGRLIHSAEIGATNRQLMVYSIPAGRQNVAINPVHANITASPWSLSWVNCKGAPILAAVTSGAVFHILELSV